MHSQLYQKRYPRVSQTHQLPAHKMQQPASSNDVNYVPTSEPKFYNIPSGFQSGNISESWVPQNFVSSDPVQSQPLLPQAGYWQQPYSTSQHFDNESWKWNNSNSGGNLNNHFQQQAGWQQAPPPPYQQSSNVYDNQPYTYQPPLDQGVYSKYSHHLPSWNSSTMDSNTNTKMEVPANNSQQQTWQFSASDNSQNQSLLWPHSGQQNAEPSHWSGSENSQNSNINATGDSWSNQASQCLTLPTEKPQQLDSNYLQYGHNSNYVVESASKSDNTHISPKTIEITEMKTKVDGVQYQNSDSNCSDPAKGDGNIPKDLVEGDQGSSSLSAFFNNDLPHEIPCADDPSFSISLPGGDKVDMIPKNDKKHGLDAELQCNTVDPSVTENCLSQMPDMSASLEVTDFVQNESDHSLRDGNPQAPFSPAGFTEEPLNQEVPEPSSSGSSVIIKPSTRIALQDSKNNIYNLQSSNGKEPRNQQIPIVVDEISAMPVVESERVIIHAREESPFKPPPKLSSVKDVVVQHEGSLLPPPSHDSAINSVRGVQDVNLETVPDNLERPPDTEEQKKQSSWSTFHRHHVRNTSDSSSSTSLWESPDIPCVTLVPAKPQVTPHSALQPKPKDSEQVSLRPMINLADTVTIGSVRSLDREDVNIPSSKPPLPPSEEEKSKPSELHTISLLPVGISPYVPYLDQQNVHHNSTPTVSHVEKTAYVESSRENIEKGAYADKGRQNSDHSQKFSTLEFASSLSLDTASHKSQITAVSSESLTATSASSLSRDNTDRNTDRQPSYQYEASSGSSRNSEHLLEHTPRNRLVDNRCSSFDERNYYAERDRSRPSSRMSLHEPPDRRIPEQDPRKLYPPHYERAPSRMSESGAGPPGKCAPSYPYYERQYYDDRYPGYSRDDEYYQRNRNYQGGYDYDPYRQERNPYYAYYDPYRYSYSSYNYGFYDELYRNDPRYRQELEERYRQYYAKLGYETDQEKSSIHSGRSSANELTKDIQSGHMYAEQDGDSNDSGHSVYNQQYYGYDDVSGKQSSMDMSTEQINATRLTPAKFSCPHPICRFSPGGTLLTVIPKKTGSTQPPLIEFHNMQVIMERLASHEELKQFQGPLVRVKTHKNDIIEFCLHKIKYFSEKQEIPDRESYILLWQLMVLLLRQNGSVAGSDIAELLLKDHEVLHPASLFPKHNVETPQGDSSVNDVGESSNHAPSGDTSSPDEGIVVSRDKTILAASSSIDVDKLTRKFREFLLFGHKKDALEWAMKHGLWGHALFLASKVDLRTYANVMTRFANSLELNDPLQTLYQLMSGRQPAAVTCLADEKWGDWRPHLAMVLSNPSPHPEVDSRSITALGDTLAARGCLPAAHFCYLMAQVEFGTYSRKSSKMVLLSSNHLLPFDEFATNEAIQCSEIYEYAQSLANPGYMLSHLQAYKFIYATRLTEHGFLQEALHYCEVISDNFHSNPSLFPVGLIVEVHKLATKLKYHDPIYMQGQGEWEEQGDPEWLQKLTMLLQSFQDCAAEPLLQYGNISEFDPNSNMEGCNNAPGEVSAHALPDTEIPNQNLYSQPVPQSVYQGNHWEGLGSVQQSEMQPYESISPNGTNHLASNLNTNQWSMSPDNHISYEETEKVNDMPPPPLNQSSNSSYDYYGASIQQGHAMRQNSRERTSSTSSIGTQRDRQDSNVSSNSMYGVRPPVATVSKEVQESNQKTRRKEEKPKSQQVGKTWLGGIFSKLMPKGPNQMILPDDKNPAIIWDSTKNCWINTDSTEEDDTVKPVAPPTDFELMGKSNPVDLPQAPIMPSKNKFQRPKARGMRQNYVDIMNPNNNSSVKSSVGNEMLFPPPPQQTSASKLFIPSVTAAEENPTDFVSSGQSVLSSPPLESEDNFSQLSSPLMLDPAEFDSRRSSIGSLRHSVGPAGRRTYPT